MTSSLAWLVLLAPGAFVVVALTATTHPGPRPTGTQRLGAAMSWVGVIVAVVAGVAVAANGLIESPTIGRDGLGLSIRLDSLSSIMLVMITLLAVVIFRFSCTYLDGDERHGVFLGRLAATIAAVEVLVLAGNTVLLVLAWIATSLALHELLVFYRQRRRAVMAARKKFIVARIGDAFLIAAAALLYHRFGTGNLESIFDGMRAEVPAGWTLGSAHLAALFLAVAAILKAAQFPTHGWLVEVMETPTPVSALLHAGILNAGPFLAIRMAFILDGSHVATTLLITAGGFTALFASVVLLTQPSVKVALGYSSAAHMGFMLMVCGMGVYPAALLHLVAHSFYKAHAFLSTGSVIDEARGDKVAIPRRLGRPSRVVASLVVSTGLYAALAFAFGVDVIGDPILLAVGAILVMGTTQIVAPALDSAGPAEGVTKATLLAFAVTVSFFSLESGFHAMLDRTVPSDGTREALQYVAVGLVLLAFVTVVTLQILDPARPSTPRRRALAVHLRNGLYANAVFDRIIGALTTNPATSVAPATEVAR